MNQKSLKKKVTKLQVENEAIIKEVQGMQEQINQLQQNIAAKKEQHDFQRGKLNAIEELVKELDEATKFAVVEEDNE